MAENNYQVPTQQQVPAAPQPGYAVVGQTPRPRGWAILFKALICLGVFEVFEQIGIELGYSLGLGTAGLYLCYEAFGALGGILCIIALGGVKLLKPKSGDISYAFRVAWRFIAISAGMLVMDLFAGSGGDPLLSDWPLQILWALALCILIGYSEETLCRGILHNGLLARFGGTRKGIYAAAILSSLYFGILHIDFTALVDPTPIEIGQAIGKVLQTGVYGFALAAIVTRRHDIHGVALIHGFDDFLLFVSSVIYYGTDVLETEYVVSGDEGMEVLILYAVMVALYMPVVIKAWKILGEVPLEERGAFYPEEHRQLLPAAPTANPAFAAAVPVASTTVPVAPVEPQVVPTPVAPAVPQAASAAEAQADTQLNSSQNATADDDATLSESTS